MNINDGYYDGVITGADIIRSRYAKEGENRMEVELTCTAKDAAGNVLATDVLCYMEISCDYPKFGDSTKPFWQQTLDRLHGMGFVGEDLSTVSAQMTGKACRLAYVTKDKHGQPVKNPGWRLSFERERVGISGADANAALKAMMSGGFVAAPVAAPAATPAAPVNPFN